MNENNNESKNIPGPDGEKMKTPLNPDAEANLRCRIKDLEDELRLILIFYQGAIDDHRAGMLTEENCRECEQIIDSHLRRNKLKPIVRAGTE
jgi:hypothetical protein